MRAGLAGALCLAALGAGATAPLESVPDGSVAYRLSIAGIPIGSAAMTVTLRDGRYAIDGTADFGFLFWGGTGGARAEGTAAGGALRPERYRLAYEGLRRPGGVSIDFAGGRAVRWESFPPPPPEFAEGRIAVTEAHLTGVLDPLSALVIPAPQTADPDAVCRRLLPVFSGYTRFDLQLTGATAHGAGVACAASYRPVAGHRPDSRSVARITAPGAFEVALAPISPEVWGPARVAVQTRFGQFEMVRQP